MIVFGTFIEIIAVIKKINYEKVLLMVMLFVGIAAGASAQEGTVKKEKVKKTSTIPQKVHNTFSKHKKYSGVKVKQKVDKPTSNQ